MEPNWNLLIFGFQEIICIGKQPNLNAISILLYSSMKLIIIILNTIILNMSYVVKINIKEKNIKVNIKSCLLTC